MKRVKVIGITVDDFLNAISLQLSCGHVEKRMLTSTQASDTKDIILERMNDVWKGIEYWCAECRDDVMKEDNA